MSDEQRKDEFIKAMNVLCSRHRDELTDIIIKYEIYKGGPENVQKLLNAFSDQIALEVMDKVASLVLDQQKEKKKKDVSQYN